MKHIQFLLLILIGFTSNGNAQADQKTFDNVKRIVFLGNSITYQGSYVSHIEAYMTINHPTRQFEFINVGLPSETVSGLSEPGHAGGKFARPDLHERLNRVLNQLKPDLVFACYGMNDGIQLPFDDARFAKYKVGIKWLNEEVLKAGSQIIFITPPIYDGKKRAYSNTLDIYSSWLISQRYTADWKVSDIHWPMRKYLENKREVDSTFRFAKDGVHPNKDGHWLMAKHILDYLGEKNVPDTENAQKAFSHYSNGSQILQLIKERQSFTKDTYLNATGHKRPHMKEGLPLEEAIQKGEIINEEILELLNVLE
jgi:lysophospholipase L1-like esterase